MTKRHFDRNKRVAFWGTAGLFLPLLFPWPGVSSINTVFLGYYLPSGFLFSLLMAIVIGIYIVMRKRKGFLNLPSLFVGQFLFMTLFFFMFGIFSLVQASSDGRISRSFVQLLYFSVPYYYASGVIAVCLARGISVKLLVRYSVLASLTYILLYCFIM